VVPARGGRTCASGRIASSGTRSGSAVRILLARNGIPRLRASGTAPADDALEFHRGAGSRGRVLVWMPAVGGTLLSRIRPMWRSPRRWGVPNDALLPGEESRFDVLVVGGRSRWLAALSTLVRGIATLVVERLFHRPGMPGPRR